MSKSKLLIIVIAAVLVLGAVVTCFFLFRGDEGSSQTPNNGDSLASDNEVSEKDNWLTVDTIPKLEALAKKNNITIELDVEDAYVGGLPFAEGDASYNYKFDSDKKIVGLSIGHILVGSIEADDNYTMEEIDAQELSKRVRAVFDWISEFLSVQIGNKFYIIANEGDLLPVEDENSYQRIIEGTAFLELRILDVDGSVWIMVIESIGGYNMVSCVLEHHPSDSSEAKIPCNVAIEE